MTDEIVDLSQPLSAETPVYPGDGGVVIDIVETARDPDAETPRRLNVGRLALGLHNGTHLDAPFHFFSDRPTVESLPLTRCCGPGVWLDLRRTRQAGVIDAVDLEPHRSRMQARPKVLLATGWDARWAQPNYFTEHPVLTAEAAQLLADLPVDLVGVDFPSVDLPPFPAHLELLGRDVLIVENLTRIAELGDEEFDFFAAPLAVTGRDASPVRAFAIRNRS